MINLPAVEHDHVLTAIEQFEAAGGAALMAGRESSGSDVVLWHEGRTYDGTVIVGLAHGLATGFTPGPAEVRGKAAQVAKRFRVLGFDVLGPAKADPAPRRSTTRRTSTSATRSAKPEPRKPAICPTCFMALPATGVCDTCG